MKKAAQTKLVLTYTLGHRDQGYNKGEKQGSLDSIHFDCFQAMPYNKILLSLSTKYFIIYRYYLLQWSKNNLLLIISRKIMFNFFRHSDSFLKFISLFMFPIDLNIQYIMTVFGFTCFNLAPSIEIEHLMYALRKLFYLSSFDYQTFYGLWTSAPNFVLLHHAFEAK